VKSCTEPQHFSFPNIETFIAFYHAQNSINLSTINEIMKLAYY